MRWVLGFGAGVGGVRVVGYENGVCIVALLGGKRLIDGCMEELYDAPSSCLTRTNEEEHSVSSNVSRLRC